MAVYYVNKSSLPNGDHEIHKIGCPLMPGTEKKLYIGDFSDCSSALVSAKRLYPQSNGCPECSKECNTE